MTILLITGSRGFNDKVLLEEAFNQFDGDIELIIHGGAKGADTLAEDYAVRNNIPSKVFRPVREDLGSYYLHRNAEMVALCDEVLAFWMGESRGTKFTIEYAKSRKKKVTIVKGD